MQIRPTITTKMWLENPEAAAIATDTFVDSAIDLLNSGGFWGSVGVGLLIALRFVPQFAPAYSGLAGIAGSLLAPKVHRQKVRQLEKYADNFVKTVDAVERVSLSLPNSNGVKKIKQLLDKTTDSEFYEAVQEVTKSSRPISELREPKTNSVEYKA